MIYVDPLRPANWRYMGPTNWRYKYSCHMCADSLRELIIFAIAMRLKHSWLHKNHFDLTPAKQKEALHKGAILLTTREFLKKIKIQIV